jgi:hypothetical protein
MIGEDVVPATVAVVIEADLDRDEPPGRAEHGRHGVLELRMARIHEAVQLLSVPRQPHLEASAKGRCNSVDLVERDAVPVTPLDALDDLARDTGHPREVLLPQPEASPQDAEPITNRSPHGPILAGRAYRAITTRLPVCDKCPLRGRYEPESGLTVDKCPQEDACRLL